MAKSNLHHDSAYGNDREGTTRRTLPFQGRDEMKGVTCDLEDLARKIERIGQMILGLEEVAVEKEEAFLEALPGIFWPTGTRIVNLAGELRDVHSRAFRIAYGMSYEEALSAPGPEGEPSQEAA